MSEGYLNDRIRRGEKRAEEPMKEVPTQTEQIVDVIIEKPVPPPDQPIPMIINCPFCGQRHIDEGEFATKPHHTHACQHCGFVWRPAVVPTVGVQFLPGFKNEEPPK